MNATTNPHLAALIIARSWRRWRYRTVFQALKAALYKAERTVSIDIMKKLCPREAAFVTDPITQPRVRFRFGGEAFPPNILFKVYTKSMNVHYFSGNRLIESGSQAARDACQMMGARAFTDLVINKAMYVNSRHIAEPSDVTNRMEYVKYMNEMDQLAPKHGGRNNGWRELSFSAISSQATVYDNNSYLRSNTALRPRGVYSRKSKLSTTESKPMTNSNSKRQQQHNPATHMAQLHVELEDDFVNLFEWTTNLHIGDLEDYIAV
ncbi:UNVERIFIED_CONTAM: putative protein CXorf58 [Siphonaria sp. JEL0065]|nr:putative protein CXorf58 [Siphonaria sp. JEL0065]